MSELRCGECGSPMILRNSKFGLFYGCSRYPDCKGTASAHQNSGKPMGIPADQETKEWRVKAHEAFDKLWKEWGYKRKEAYKLLQTMMNLSEKEAHIAKFNKEQCQELIKKIEETYAAN